MKKFHCSILCSLFSISLVAATEVLFEDDFENGFNPAWARVGSAIEIVEDQSNPGNHVARFTETQQRLLSIPADLAQAEEFAEDLERWKNYEFSFRFRFGSLESDPAIYKTHTNLLSVFFNSNPNPDNTQEKRLLSVQMWRHGVRANAWRVTQPAVAWYGERQRLESILHEQKFEQPSDTEWHTMRIISDGPLTTVYFDDQEIYRGRDDRATYGGVGIVSWWNDDVLHPGWLEIDDVKVVKLP